MSGSNSKHSESDTLDEFFFIENKYRKAHATFSLWMQTRKKAKREKKLPVITLVEARRKGFLVVIHSNHLKRFVREMRKRVRENLKTSMRGE